MWLPYLITTQFLNNLKSLHNDYIYSSHGWPAQLTYLTAK